MTMDYSASIAILVAFFAWVFIATLWWKQKMKKLESEINERNFMKRS